MDIQEPPIALGLPQMKFEASQGPRHIDTDLVEQGAYRQRLAGKAKNDQNDLSPGISYDTGQIQQLAGRIPLFHENLQLLLFGIFALITMSTRPDRHGRHRYPWSPLPD